MENNDRVKPLGWFVPLRMATYIVLLAVVFWMDYPRFLHFQYVLYSVLTLLFAVGMALERRVRLRTAIYAVIALQFLLEISIESGIIYATGNIHSSFSALFLLTIVSASLVYRLAGTLVVASLVSTAYAFIIWLGLTETSQADLSLESLKTIFAANDSVFYPIFLHILIFYLVAFISGYLAERLSTQNKELADASQALKRAQLETDEILSHLNSGLLTIDSRGHVIYFNHAAERILGYREEDVRGLPCAEAFAERMPQLSNRLTQVIVDQVHHPRQEVEIVDAAGRVVPVGLSTSVLTDEHDRLRGVIAIFSDLTEAKALEAKVRAADRLAAVGEMSASIAHEIRNPLAAISGSVEVLRSDLKVTGENQRLMELIVKESHRLSRILSDFLSFARVERTTMRNVELLHIIHDVVEIVYHSPSYHSGIEIDIRTDASAVYVVGDENLVKQLLVNLALNACEAFDGRAGHLLFRVSTAPGGDEITLEIKDDGPGIDPEQQEKIFQPFYSTKKQGTGLGLSIVHRICAALKLGLAVQSGMGEGTTFIVEFQPYSADRTGDDAPVVDSWHAARTPTA